MLTSVERTYRSSRRDDGYALIAAVAIVGLVGLLVATMVAVTLRETRQTGRDRQRSAAVTSAEGAVDKSLANIQEAAPDALPCGTSTVADSEARPDTLTIATTVTYFDASGAPIDCTLVQDATSNVVASSALVKSTSTSTPIAGQAPAVRTIETAVRLTPAFANGLDKAIFGNSGVTLANKTELYGRNGTPDADIYTNGSFTCSNNEHFRGSIYAQGSIVLSNSCRIDVDAWSKLGFTSDSPQATVSGDVKVSQGTATINAGTILGNVKAQAISPASWCTSHPDHCTIGVGVVTDPPSYTFPQLNWNSTVAQEWAEAGYATVVTDNNCTYSGNGSNGPGQWIVDNGNHLTGPTILTTTCQVVLQNPNNNPACGNKRVCLNDNLAVFADGGITISNTLTITSTDQTSRHLYLIQPYDAVPSPCTTIGINLDNQVTISPTVTELLYSPCSVRKANNTDHYGQIYAGGYAQIDNQLTMYYTPLPVWGVDATTTKVESYSADILYKRENLS